jgi:hypothetical protein
MLAKSTLDFCANAHHPGGCPEGCCETLGEARLSGNRRKAVMPPRAAADRPGRGPRRSAVNAHSRKTPSVAMLRASVPPR